MDKRYRCRRKTFKVSKFLRFLIVVGFAGYLFSAADSLPALVEGTPLSAFLSRGGPGPTEVIGDDGTQESTSLQVDGVSSAWFPVSRSGDRESTEPRKVGLGLPLAVNIVTSGYSNPPDTGYGLVSNLQSIDGYTTAAGSVPVGSVLNTVGPTGSDKSVDELTKVLGLKLNAGVGDSGGMDSPSAEVSERGTQDPVAPAEPEPPPLVVTHKVAPGETLWDISRKYNVNMDTIILANQLNNVNQLRIGQSLKVLTRDGVLYRVERGDSIWTIATKFDVSVDAIIAGNELADPSMLRIGQELFIPGLDAVRASRYRLVGPDGRLRAAFDRPVSGGWISSRFGRRWGRLHAGVDIAVPTGTPVRAAAAGIVTYSGAKGGYGLLVTIDHGHSVETRYGHNSRLVVRVGQRVSRGQVIAYSGNTGRSTGPHLHFEIRLRGKPYDPLKYIK